MNSLFSRLLGAVSALTVLFLATPGFASGRVTNVNAGDRFAVVRFTQPVGSVATIETTGLSASADTILNIFDGSVLNQFLAGNDDVSGTDRRSRVQNLTNGSAYPREIVMVVRAYSSASAGTGTLRVTSSTIGYTNTTVTNWPILFEAGSSVSVGAYSAGIHVMTVEQQRGAADTIFMLVPLDQAHATAYDDDSGLGLMSFVHANEGCSVGCSVRVGSFWSPGGATGPATVKPTTVIWDSDMHVANADADQDGLSASLEAVLTTSPTDADTDQDGLPDGVEVLGGDEAAAGGEWRQVRYPYFGSNPKQKDLFVQADWNTCNFVEGQPSTFPPCRRASTEPPTPDRFQIVGADAERIAVKYSEVGISIHLDIGQDPPADANGNRPVSYVYGAWNGAQRRTDFQGGNTHCQYRVGVRVSGFHYVKVNGTGGGQADAVPGHCAFASVRPWDVTHEVGHQLNLDHAPRWTGPFAANGQPNYLSIMNYPFSDEIVKGQNTFWPFSDGHLNSWAITPGAFDEDVVLTSEQLGILTNDYFKLTTDGSGRVDWNRDGNYGGVVAGPLSFGDDIGQWGISIVRPTSPSADFGTGAFTAWALAPNHSDSRLLLFARKGGLLEVRAAAPGSLPTEASPGSSLDWQDVAAPAGFLGLANTPAAFGYTRNGVHKVIVAGTRDDGSLVASTATNTNGVISWDSLPTLLQAAGATGLAHEGGTSVVVDGDVAYVYVTSYLPGVSRVREYAWNLATGAISATSVAVGSTFVSPENVGVGATIGYSPLNGAFGASTRGVVLLVPQYAATPIEGTSQYVSELHMYGKRSGAWVELPMVSGESSHGAQPAIGYVPFNIADPSVGRYYVAFRGSYFDSAAGTFATKANNHIKFSKGNLALNNNAQSLTWPTSSSLVTNFWSFFDGSFQLHFDDRIINVNGVNQFPWPRLIGTRTATVYPDSGGPTTHEPWISPYIDNILPGTLYSQSDRPSMRGALRCTLAGGPCQCQTRDDVGCE